MNYEQQQKSVEMKLQLYQYNKQLVANSGRKTIKMTFMMLLCCYY